MKEGRRGVSQFPGPPLKWIIPVASVEPINLLTTDYWPLATNI